MNLIRWQPRMPVRSRWEEIDGDLDRLFNLALAPAERSHVAPMTPAMDVTEEENRYVVRADLPGMSKDDIDITYQDGILTIKGERKGEVRREGARNYVRERFEGKFGRNLQLPEKVDSDRVEATMKDGVLELVLPFTPDAQPRKIQVNG